MVFKTTWHYPLFPFVADLNAEKGLDEGTFPKTGQVLIATEAGGEGINLQFCQSYY